MIILKMLIAINMEFSLPNMLLPSICWVESNHNPKAVNPKDPSYGLCQIKTGTASWMMKRKVFKEELMNAKFNAKVAATYLNYQLRRYDGDLKKAISAYNAGRYITGNKRYVSKVMKRINLYNENNIKHTLFRKSGKKD